jgi:UMF1 family MFS transporter
MYDWANSAYVTTVAVGLLPVYFADVVVGHHGVLIGGTQYSATALWGFVASAAAFVTFLFAPVLGAVSDFSAAKKRFLLAFAYGGSLFTFLLYFCHSGHVYRTMLFFLLAQIGFAGANVFYNGFLPQITSEDKIDAVSANGYAYGYVGGGIQFALALGLVLGHEAVGISQDLAVRIAVAMAGVWWAGFTLFTARYLYEAPSVETLPERYRRWPRFLAYVGIGLARTLRTSRRVGRFRHLLLFLIAFMVYNDGIQTVIKMASIFAKEELGLSVSAIMLTLLIIQAIAFFGALLFGRLAGWIGTKSAVMVSLVLWSAVVSLAYFIHTAAEFFALGAAVGLVLGGSQALSRAFYGRMIPEGANAEFFGFYTVFDKFSAIWGPLVFALIRQWTGSARLSIVSLIPFFLLGLLLLCFVDEKKAHEAKNFPS